MDVMWIVWFLIFVLVLAVGYWIIKTMIMPAVPAGAQAIVWAVIGIFLLIVLIMFFASGGHMGSLFNSGHHSLDVH